MWAASVRRAASAAKYATAATTATLVTNDTNCFYETRKRIGAYDLGPTLGEGAFATVRKASKGGETYACKIINTARMNEELCKKEVEMMRRAGKHANLVSLVDVVELPDARALVLELATGGEVFERICEKGCYSEKDAALVAKQVALALKHLHSKGIAHRDLKPENLLLVSDAHDADVKLCDLGIAAAPCEKLDKRVGTPGYAAPEMLLATKKKTYDARCDLFALGVILFVLLGGYHPFDPMGDASDAILASRIKQGKWQFHDEAWAKISPEAKDVVRHLLAVKPDDRWDVDDVLSSPWVAGSASSAPIGNNERLRAFNQARRTWAAAIRAAALVASAPVAAAHHSATGTLSDEARAELREAFDGLDVEGIWPRPGIIAVTACLPETATHLVRLRPRRQRHDLLRGARRGYGVARPRRGGPRRVQGGARVRKRCDHVRRVLRCVEIKIRAPRATDATPAHCLMSTQVLRRDGSDLHVLDGGVAARVRHI